jgi:hypothetical protein
LWLVEYGLLKLHNKLIGVEGEMFKNGMRPIYAGEVLPEEYLHPLGVGVSVRAIAIALNLLMGELGGEHNKHAK